MKLMLCSRCGKQTILFKTWKEYVETRAGRSELIHQQYVCPDEVCQKKGEESLRIKREESKAREEAELKREQDRNASRNKTIKDSQRKK